MKDAIRKIAQGLVNKQEIKKKIFDFFRENPNPVDKDVHAFAESLGIDEHQFEEIIYSILGDFLGYGKYNEKIKEDPNFTVDPKQVEMGIKVEMEHVAPDAFLIANRIALDHLVEMDDYYTKLAKMEQEGV